jgi:hypothetical protein
VRIGDRVRFGNIHGEPRLNGAAGEIVRRWSAAGYWVVKLDEAIPGFLSGTAWATEDELAIIENGES